MKKIILYTLTVLFLTNCSSEKIISTNNLKSLWEINYVKNQVKEDIVENNVNVYTDFKSYDKINVANESLLASRDKLPNAPLQKFPTSIKNDLYILQNSINKKNKLFAPSEKIIKSHLLNNLETDLEKISKSLYEDLLVNNKKCVTDEIEKSDNNDRDGFILNLIGVSFLVLITGLDVFLALFSIAFDGFFGVSLFFFFSSLLLTYLSIKAVKKLNEKYPKKKSKSENNQSSKKLFKTVLKTLGLIIGALILTAIMFNEIIL